MNAKRFITVYLKLACAAICLSMWMLSAPVGYCQYTASSSSDHDEAAGGPIELKDLGLSLDRSTANGLVISEIGTGAIGRFGLRKGDRIYTVNGKDVDDEAAFMSALFDPSKRDEEASIIVYRHARPWTIRIDPQALLKEFTAARSSPLEGWGLVLSEQYTDHAVVERVRPDSAAFRAGFRPGDVIATFGGTPVASRQEFVQLAGQVPVGASRGLLFGVLRGGLDQPIDLPLAGTTGVIGGAANTTDAAVAAQAQQQFGNNPDVAFQPDTNQAVSPAATAQPGAVAGQPAATGTTAAPTATLLPQSNQPAIGAARTSSGTTAGSTTAGRTSSGTLFPSNAPTGIGTGRTTTRQPGVIPSGAAGTMIPGSPRLPPSGGTPTPGGTTQSTQVPGVISGSARTPLGTGGGGLVSPPRP